MPRKLLTFFNLLAVLPSAMRNRSIRDMVSDPIPPIADRAFPKLSNCCLGRDEIVKIINLAFQKVYESYEILLHFLLEKCNIHNFCRSHKYRLKKRRDFAQPTIQ